MFRNNVDIHDEFCPLNPQPKIVIQSNQQVWSPKSCKSSVVWIHLSWWAEWDGERSEPGRSEVETPAHRADVLNFSERASKRGMFIQKHVLKMVVSAEKVVPLSVHSLYVLVMYKRTFRSSNFILVCICQMHVCIYSFTTDVQYWTKV